MSCVTGRNLVAGGNAPEIFAVAFIAIRIIDTIGPVDEGVTANLLPVVGILVR